MSLAPAVTEPETLNPDEMLARRCAAGDPTVFEAIYGRYAERFKSIAYNHLGNVHDAEDAVQETFLKLHLGRKSYSGLGFSTWLYRILVNTCNDIRRRRKRRIEETPIDDAIASTHAAAGVDDAKRLMLAKLVGELSERRRTVFILFEIEGFSHSEIARILGIAEPYSRWLASTTKKLLRKKWNHDLQH